MLCRVDEGEEWSRVAQEYLFWLFIKSCGLIFSMGSRRGARM